MKFETKTFQTFLVLLLMSTQMTFGQNATRDIYGREIVNSKGEKINYSANDTVVSKLNKKSNKIQSKSTNFQKFNNNQIKEVKVDNLFSVMGTSIGLNSMHSVDIDNDGIVELICAASSSSGFGSVNFWYIMKCKSKDNSCNQVWVSSQYASTISSLEVIDFNNDKKYSIVLTFTDGSILIYDAKTKDLLKNIKPVEDIINSLVYADADNDSIKDIVIACESNTYVLDANTFDIKAKINQGAKQVRVGNVDSNSNNEVVLSYGAVYRISGSTATNLWRFNRNPSNFVELSDIDGDDMQEIIFAESWYKINIYDVDTKTTKYSITSKSDISSLHVIDTNDDGVDEILYGDGQWGEVVCYNAVTRTKMWSVNNPEHGVAAINYADLYNDGKKELIWSAGWTSSGPDYLFVYDVNNKKLLWRSDDIGGPFYAVAKGDVDADGKDDIVAVSYDSESGYGSGVLIIIDAQTNKLKWKSNGDFFNQVWTGIHNVSIKDIDNDGQNEIIIAAGETYTGGIWIVDGKNYSIKSSNIFNSDDIDTFYALTVDDVDNDGEQELIAASNSAIYSIRPSDWAIEWKVSFSNFSFSKPIIRCADLNGDKNKETLVCNGEIQIINGLDQSYWTSEENYYVNFDLFDVNEDGILDIVATTTNGHIVTIDGKTLNIINDINPETETISSVRLQKIDNELMYIYSYEGRIHFYKNEFSHFLTQFLGENVGEIESLKIFNSVSGDTEILVGTNVSVLRLNADLESFFLSTHSVNINFSTNNDFQIYPVPAKNEVFVSLSNNNNVLNARYDLIDISGQMIKNNVQIKNQIEEIDLTGLKPGLYLVRLKVNDLYTIKKFIKD